MDYPFNSTNATSSAPGFEWPDKSWSIMWILLIPFALFGNIFVIWTVLKVPQMKSPTNILFVNMAVCDIITVLTMTAQTISLVYNSSQVWFDGTFGLVSCKAVGYASHITIAGSIFALVLMAIDRFFAIICVMRNVTFFKRYKTVSVVVWLPSIIIVLPVVFFMKAPFNPSEGITICFLGWQGSPFWKGFFYAYVFVLLYLVPLFILSVLYGIIAKVLWFSKIPNEAGDWEKIQKRQRKKRKIVKMLMIILAVFAICWLPIQIFHVYSALGQSSKLSTPFLFFAQWFCQVNSAINPVLYITLHSGFKRAFMDCLRKCGFPVKKQHRNETMYLTQTKQTTVSI